jgi:hypothetical protein
MRTWTQLIEKTFKQKVERNWDSLYWVVDLHDTVIEGKYNRFNEGSTIYPYAKETLEFLYHHPVHKSILWTSSYDDSIENVLQKFDLKFNYLHINPECPNTSLCNFDRKLYFNFLLDDKALFDPHTDWKEIYECLMSLENSKK